MAITALLFVVYRLFGEQGFLPSILSWCFTEVSVQHHDCRYSFVSLTIRYASHCSIPINFVNWRRDLNSHHPWCRLGGFLPCSDTKRGTADLLSSLVLRAFLHLVSIQSCYLIGLSGLGFVQQACEHRVHDYSARLQLCTKLIMENWLNCRDLHTPISPTMNWSVYGHFDCLWAEPFRTLLYSPLNEQAFPPLHYKRWWTHSLELPRKTVQSTLVFFWYQFIVACLEFIFLMAICRGQWWCRLLGVHFTTVSSLFMWQSALQSM